MMRYKSKAYRVLGLHTYQGGTKNSLLGEPAYSFDCTFFRLICLTAKALCRITMRAFLVGATEPKERTLKRVNAMDGVYSAFAGAKSCQLRFLG